MKNVDLNELLGQPEIPLNDKVECDSLKAAFGVASRWLSKLESDTEADDVYYLFSDNGVPIRIGSLDECTKYDGSSATWYIEPPMKGVYDMATTVKKHNTSRKRHTFKLPNSINVLIVQYGEHRLRVSVPDFNAIDIIARKVGGECKLKWMRKK